MTSRYILHIGFGARFVRPIYTRCYDSTISESAQTIPQRLAHRGQVDLWARTKIDEAASQLKLVGV